MLELYLRGRSMRIIEIFKRLFHCKKPIEIKPNKNVNAPTKMKQKKDLNPPKKMKQTYVAKSTNYLDEHTNYFKPFSLDILSFVVCPFAKIIWWI